MYLKILLFFNKRLIKKIVYSIILMFKTNFLLIFKILMVLDNYLGKYMRNKIVGWHLLS
jgi:hypothetical protein